MGYDTLKDIILRCENNKPSHELFAQLFDMLVEDKFNEETCCTIKNPAIIPLLFKLCNYCDESFISEFVNVFVSITEKNISNQNSCYTAHLMEILLEMVDKIGNKPTQEDILINGSGRLRDNLIYLIEILGKHSITVKELKKFFSLLKEKSKNATSSILPHLLKALQAMTHNDPEAFFDFDGHSSGLKLPILYQWPTPKGYTISMWLRIESFEEKSKYKPILFSFINTDGDGIECYFEQNSLCFSLISGGGKQVTTKQMDFVFVVSLIPPSIDACVDERMVLYYTGSYKWWNIYKK